MFQSDVRTIDPTVVQSTTSWHDGSVQNWSVGRSVGQSIMVRQPVGQSGGNSFNSHLDINWQVKRLTSITLLSLLVLRFIISGVVGQSINETSIVRFSINLSTFTKKKRNLTPISFFVGLADDRGVDGGVGSDRPQGQHARRDHRLG